jgi:hypothetical protein
MPVEKASRRQAAAAIKEATKLLQRAERSVTEAREDFDGELLELATRVARHIGYLKDVSELISHEMEQRRNRRRATVVSLPRPRLAITRR